MKKVLFARFVVIAILLLFAFNNNPASALELANEGDETYAIQINDLNCELTDYELNLDLWRFSITGRYTVTLTNSGDTNVSISWTEPVKGTAQKEEKEILVPPNTVVKYDILFSFNLLSRDFSYEYSEIY